MGVRGAAVERAPEAPEAAEVARRFLSALEARDLDTAATALAPGCTLVFPGAPPMTSLAEVLAWARPRYRFVGKTIAAIEVFPAGAASIVYVRGTLHGAWPDGRAFDGVRFIDRFEIAAGQIVRQEVWNDLAEARGA